MPYIIDQIATKTEKPTSRFLTKKELQKAQPGQHHTQQGLSIVFHPELPVKQPREICQAFIDKYDSIVAVDIQGQPQKLQDELDKMSYQNLMKVAGRLKIKTGNMKADQLREAIRKKRQSDDNPSDQDTITPVNSDYYNSEKTVNNILSRKDNRDEIEKSNWQPVKIGENQWIARKL